MARRFLAGPERAVTLPELMIVLLLIAILCLAMFAGLQTVSRIVLSTAVRAEANRLLQAEAERLVSVPYPDFTATGTQDITSSFRTSFRPGTQAALTHPGSDSAGRVTFRREVVQVTSTATTRTLQVQVSWLWQGQSRQISTPVFRSQ